MTSSTPRRAASRTPAGPGRAARTDSRAIEGAGQPPSPHPAGEGGPSSSQPSERQAVGKAVPGPGEGSQGKTSPGRGQQPGPSPEPGECSQRGRTAPGPRKGAGGGESAGAPLPDRSQDSSEERAAQRKDWKAAQSAHSAALRRGRVKRAPKATGPGMIRRLPPGEPGGAA
jgi:hypothetical protein